LVALIIDNDVKVRETLCDELRQHLGRGSVTAADSSFWAATLLRESSPDLLFLDLSTAESIDLRSSHAPPPAIVILSATDLEGVRRLRAVGLNAWMKPEIFAEVPRILRWAELVRLKPNELWDQWAMALSRIGSESNSPRVIAIENGSQLSLDSEGILALRGCGSTTKVVMSGGTLTSPHSLTFLANELRGHGFVRCGKRLLVNRRRPWRWFTALTKWVVRGGHGPVQFQVGQSKKL
jgi:DNA-binding LytR/AlgR family response regulator